MKTISLVCGKRHHVFDFYNRFTDHKIKFLSGSDIETTTSFPQLKPNHTLSNLSLSNPYYIDPVSWFYSRANNLSWKYFEGLEDQLQATDLIGLYDTYYFWNHQAVSIAKKKELPVFCEIWCNIPHHITSKLPPYSFITKELINYCSLFILHNESARQFTRSIGIPDEKTRLIYMGINLDHFTPALINKKSDVINILYVGALTKEKGLLELLEAFEILHRDTASVSLTIAGQGPLEALVLKKAQSLPIAFSGFIPYSQLPALYQTADIFCSPSRTQKLFGIFIWQEYFSYTLMEAQATGLPIVTTKTGGIPEEVDPQNLLVDENNSIQLHQALLKLIGDKALRASLSKVNRARAEKMFDAQRQSRLTEEVLKQLL